MADEPTKRPEWLTDTPGVPPVIDLKANPISADEIEEARRRNETMLAEASNLWGGIGRAVMTEQQRFLALWQSRAETHRQNLEAFQAEHQTNRRYTSQIIGHSVALADALLRLGEFDEALDTLKEIGGLEADVLRQRIEDWKAADARPDEEECDCDPPGADEHIDERGNSIEMTLEAPKHHTAGEYFSKRLGVVAKVHMCAQCGHKNGHNNESEQRQQIKQVRATMERNLRLRNVPGRDARSHLEGSGHRGDRDVLVVKEVVTSEVTGTQGPRIIEQ